MAVAIETNSVFAKDSDSYAYNHTAGNMLVVLTSSLTNGGVNEYRAVYFDGVPMTRAIINRAGSGSASEIWYLKDPPTGSKTLTVFGQSGSDMDLAISLSGVDFTNGPFDVRGSRDEDGVAAMSEVVNTVSGGIVIAVLSGDLPADRTFTPSGDTVEIDEAYTGGHEHDSWAGYILSDAATETIGCTWSGAGNIDTCWVSIKPGAGDPTRVTLNDLSPVINAVTTATPFSYAVDMTGQEMLVFAVSARGGGESVSAVTYNGVSLTKQSEVNGAGGDAYIWTLLNPATGSNTLVATYSANAVQGCSYGVTNLLAGSEIKDTTSVADNQDDIDALDRGLVIWAYGSTGNPSSDSAIVDNQYNDGNWQSGHGAGFGSGYADQYIDDATFTYGVYDNRTDWIAGISLAPLTVGSTGGARAAMFFSLAGLAIPAATLAGLYKAGAVAL